MNNKNNIDNIENEWFCPVCDGESYSSITIANNSFFVCNACSVIFLDKDRFNSLIFEQDIEINKIIEDMIK